MFRSSPAMPLLARASAGRACIVSEWCSCHVCQSCFQQCLCTCEPVVAVGASYRCSRHVYQTCLTQAQQCLCLREPVRAVLASYPSGAPAMFVTHVSAMPLRMRARGGRVCIVSVFPACLLQLWQFISYNW